MSKGMDRSVLVLDTKLDGDGSKEYCDIIIYTEHVDYWEAEAVHYILPRYKDNLRWPAGCVFQQ